jgi:hygromycin-B 7''-O-kinase
LDALDDISFYQRHFLDVELWTPAVRQVCARHAISCESIRTGVPGTCPVFIVEDRWIVKLFGRLFRGAQSFEVERAANRWLALHPVLPHAPLVAEGQLQAGSAARWSWPYLIFEYWDANSVGEIFDQLAGEEKRKIACQMGTWVRALHDLELPGTPPFEPDWYRFTSFLRQQRPGCAARQRAWGTLPPGLMDQIDDFLDSTDFLPDPARRPSLIHADLTADHLLGRWVEGRWHSLGLIDFGDARAGNLEYELAALHLDLFHADREMLAAFLESYRFSPPAGFSRRMLAYSLLHEFNVFGPYAGEIRARRLEDLAEELWKM